MNEIVEVFIRRKVATAMIFTALCIIGIISASRLQIELLPDIGLPKLTVITPYRNAAPAEVEKLVTVKIEEAVTSVSGVSDITSDSFEGVSIVKVNYRWGTDMDMALIETKEKVDLIRGELPHETDKSIVVKYDPSAEPVMIYSIILKDSDNINTRRRVEKEIVPFIERINGVSLVDIFGGEKREIRVDVDNSLLYSHSLSLQDLAGRIRSANYDYPAGSVVKGDKEYQVRTSGEFTGLADIGCVTAGYNENGVPIFLSDIAVIKDSYKDKKSVIRFNGKEGVALLIRKEPGKNTIGICEDVKNIITELSENKGKDFSIKCIYDESRFVKNAIINVISATVLGGIISFFVLFFFLKSAGPPLIIATALPISMCGTFILMDIFRISINSMSLGGLAIGTGMTVDAGIVVLESISMVQIENKNLNPVESALKGTLAVAGPVVASVLTTVVVFLPVVFLDGLAGSIFRDLALAVSFSIIISLISSVSLVPMLTTIDLGFFNKIINGKTRKVSEAIAVYSDYAICKAIYTYEITVRAALNQKRRVVSWGVVSLVAGIVIFMLIEREVLPPVDTGEFAIEVEMPGGTTLEQTSRFCGMIEEILLSMDEVENVFSKTGCDTDDNISEKISGRGSDYGLIRVFMKKEAGFPATEMIERLRRNVKHEDGISVSYKIKEDVMGSLFNSDLSSVSIELYGNELCELKDRGCKVKAALTEVKDLRRISATLDRESPEFHVDVDRVRVSSLGFDIEKISTAVALAVRGEVPTIFREQDDEIDIKLRLGSGDRNNIESIKKINIKTDREEVVPLSSVASIKETTGSVRIVRREQSRVNIIKAEFIHGFEKVKDDVAEKLSAVMDKAEKEYRIVDGSAEINDALKSIFFAMVLALLFIYMLLAGQFQSFIDPLIIMLSIPVTLLGVSAALLISGQTLNINSGIGIIMLCGTVVNNGIVLFDFIDNEIKAGSDIESAIIIAGKKRLQPILMTSLTTTLAVVPVALGFGEGSELQKPLAVTIIGGQVFSTVLTLVIIPVIYAAVGQRKTAES